jgi:heptosyltransferase-3
MDCVPWVDRTWGYMRFPRHATLRENFQMISALRRAKFDAIINLNGSDRSSWLTFFSGARERLGRVPSDGGPLFWRRMFTAVVQHPYDVEPMYLQRCRCLEKAGLPSVPPEFHVTVPAENLRAAEISAADTGTYFHISPFTTADRKELAPAQLAELIAALKKNYPQKKIVLSCAPTGREQQKMNALLPLLPEKPWRLLVGNLDLTQLAAVIQHSALHLSGDTGTMHLAVMTGAPTVNWFRPNPGRHAWLPVGEQYRVVLGRSESNAPYLQQIATHELVQAAQSVLAGVPTTSYPAAQNSRS